MTIKIKTAPILSWYNSWIGHEFTLDPNAPHTDTEWCVFDLPNGENEDAPKGWMKVKKVDCEIVKP